MLVVLLADEAEKNTWGTLYNCSDICENGRAREKESSADK